MASLRVGKANGGLTLNPIYEEREKSGLDIVVTGIESPDKKDFLINMIEMEGEEMSEELKQKASGGAQKLGSISVAAILAIVGSYLSYEKVYKPWQAKKVREEREQQQKQEREREEELKAESLTKTLWEAVDENNKDLAKYKIEKKDVGINELTNNVTLLYRAVDIGNEAAVKLLLELGADPNLAIEGDPTPLHNAIQKGNLAIVDLLLERGANPNLSAKKGDTPLHWALIFSDKITDLEKIITSLLKAGADIEAKNEAGHTPLDLAEGKSAVYENKEIATLLQNRLQSLVK